MDSFISFLKTCRLFIWMLFPLRFFSVKKIWLYFSKDVIINKRVTIYKDTFEGFNQVYANTDIHFSFIGIGTYIGSNSKIFRCKIGRFCSIGSNLKVGLGMHPSSDFVSSHPAFYSPTKQAGFTFVEGKESLFKEYLYTESDYLVTIGNDVWIGYNVILMDGIKIGDGAIIGTGSVVTKDVEPYSIVGGVPAKEIKKRFNSEEVVMLQDFCWWNKDMEWLKRNSNYFKDIGFFRKNFLE